MIRVEIPGREQALCITSVVLDYNGTIARDGQLLPEAAERIRALSGQVNVYVLTVVKLSKFAQFGVKLGFYQVFMVLLYLLVDKLKFYQSQL